MNKFIGKGRLVNDIELKEIGDDRKVANFRIAIRRDYKNQAGEYESDFFNCSAFGATAQFLADYFKKGQEILLAGHLQNSQWETESGEKRVSTSIIVENVEFCGSKSNEETNVEKQIETQIEETPSEFNRAEQDVLPF